METVEDRYCHKTGTATYGIYSLNNINTTGNRYGLYNKQNRITNSQGQIMEHFYNLMITPICWCFSIF